MQFFTRKFIVAVIGVLCVTAFFITTVLAVRKHNSNGARQEQKVILTGSPIPDEPVKITDVKVAGKDVKIGEKFDSSEDWLKGIKCRLKNVSGKEIVSVEVDIVFPETASTGSEMSFPITLGHRVPTDKDRKAPISVQPGGEINVEVDEKRYTRLVEFLRSRHLLSDINKANIGIGFVVFADDTAWSAGMFYRRDPDNPNRWVPVKPQ